MPPPITLHDFVSQWKKRTLSEKASVQPHFLELCALLAVPTPTQADTEGTHYT